MTVLIVSCARPLTFATGGDGRRQDEGDFMAIQAYFSEGYQHARQQFRAAADLAGADLRSYENPNLGPAGEILTTDVAWSGPADAERVLVTISGTHGVEGFCGSGCQVGNYETGFSAELPAAMALCQIHAINPYGFAWLRRVTEENVDLNRNFIDHAAPYPQNEGYEALREVICPPEWNDQVVADTQALLDAYAKEHGARALQSAISGGQYSDPHGTFFGGWSATWAHRLLKRIFTEHLSAARQVAVIDYHTGLGPYGYGERICVHEPNSEALVRAREWYDNDVTSPYLGTSSSIEIRGPNIVGMMEVLPQAEVTAIALEYGTIPTREVRVALRADNWLHAHGDPTSAKARAIKDQIRAAFYQDKPDWQESIFERALETLEMAGRGLDQG